MEAPTLELISPGSRTRSLVLLPGYLTEKAGMGSGWSTAIGGHGFDGSVFQVRWDSSSDTTAIRSAISTLLTAAASPPHAPLVVAQAILRLRAHWGKVKSRAKAVGREYLPTLLREVPGEITVVAHSLGARVAYFGIVDGRLMPQVSRLVMCGGAVRRDSSKDWGAVAEALPDGLYNVRNRHDWVLKLGFKLAELKQNPVGLKPIKARHARIHDVDQTGWLPAKLADGGRSHSRYFEVLDPYIVRGCPAPAALTSYEARKHCRVCRRRIADGIRFGVGQRFYCRHCGHRTHVGCAASVSKKTCKGCA